MKISSIFTNIQDYRVVGRCTHLLSDILGLCLCGIIADCDDFTEIEDYGKDNITFLQEALNFSFVGGIPSSDTMERMFKYLNEKELQTCFNSFLGDLRASNQHLAIDGKELRSTIPKGEKHALVRMVNVWATDLGISFAQYQVDKKSNEITAIPALLDMITCENSVITIDAMGCQKEIVKKIREKKADYLIALKANQKNLYTAVQKQMLAERERLLNYTNIDKGHGRGEKRAVYIATISSIPVDTSEWMDLKTVVMIERTRIIKEKITIHQTFFLSSLETTPEAFGQYARKHWGVENDLHWQLDVTFREDHAKIKNETAIVNLHQCRKWALHLLKKDETKMSIKRKRKKAHRNNEYLKSIIVPN